MKTNFLQYYKPNVLVGFITVLIFGIILINGYLGWQLAFVGTIVSFLVFINRYLWKYRPFSWMFSVDNFSGRYEGELEFQYIDEKNIKQTGKLKHVKIIKQTGDRISISSFTLKTDGTKSSESSNIGMYVEKPEDDHFRLIYNYQNEGDTTQNFPQHYGTDVLKFIKKENGDLCLSGKYYTERHPHQTKGQYIDLKKINNKLTHDF